MSSSISAKYPTTNLGLYRRLNEYLAGRGVPSVQNALQELLLQPVLDPLREILNPGYLRYLLDARLCEPDAVLSPGLLDEAVEKLSHLLDGIQHLTGSRGEREYLLQTLRPGLRLALSLPTLEERYPLPGAAKYQQAVEYFQTGLPGPEEGGWAALFAWLFLHDLGRLTYAEDFETVTAGWIDEWLVGRVFSEAAREMDIPEERARDLPGLLKLLIAQQRWYENASQPAAAQTITPAVENPAAAPAATAASAATAAPAATQAPDQATASRRASAAQPDTAVAQEPASQPETKTTPVQPSLANLLETWLADEEVQRYLKVNRYEDVLWFDKGRFESFVWWMAVLAVFQAAAGPRANATLLVERLLLVHAMAARLLEAEAKSGYQVEKLLKGI